MPRKIKAKPGPTDKTYREFGREFGKWTSSGMDALFEEAMKRWNMPAAVIADELFTRLIGSCNVRKVDPALLENLELARAIRVERREQKRFLEGLCLAKEMSLPGAQR